LQHCEVNPIYPGAELRCSGWIDSLTPPTHWQYVIDAGTATPQDDGQPDETMDPVEECDTEFPEGDECVDENDDSITYTVSDLTDEEDPHERGKEPIE
jgi:hypothetical protein